MSTKLKIALCYEHDGELAQAWYAAQEGIKLARLEPVQARRSKLEDYARKILAELEPRVPKLRVRAPGAPDGLKLTYDGRLLPIEALGELLPLDPGTHTITAEAPGFLPLKKDVTLSEGQKVDVEVVLVRSPPAPSTPLPPPLEPPVAPASLVARPPVVPPPAGMPAIPSTTPPASLSRRRVTAIAVGGGGLASLAVAGVLAGMTWSKVNSAGPPNCTSDYRKCNSTGMALIDDARNLQTGALVLVGVGAAATITGVVLWTTSAKATAAPTEKDAWVEVTPLGLSVRGAW